MDAPVNRATAAVSSRATGSGARRDTVLIGVVPALAVRLNVTMIEPTHWGTEIQSVWPVEACAVTFLRTRNGLNGTGVMAAISSSFLPRRGFCLGHWVSGGPRDPVPLCLLEASLGLRQRVSGDGPDVLGRHRVARHPPAAQDLRHDVLRQGKASQLRLLGEPPGERVHPLLRGALADRR